MRLKAICRASFTVLAVLTTVCGIFAGPDIGGGSGRIMTPYKGAIKLADVATVKQFASKSRTATDVVIAGTHTTGGGGNLALMFASDGNSPVGAPMFSFQGINDAGKSATIDFSEIQSFLVSSDGKDATLAQVEVIQFPAISPADLLAKKPSFTELQKNYTRDVRLHVKIAGPAGKVLCLVAKDKATGPYRIVAKLSDLSAVNLGYGMFQYGSLPLPAIWWAVSSVTDDESYPYRTKVKKRNHSHSIPEGFFGSMAQATLDPLRFCWLCGS